MTLKTNNNQTNILQGAAIFIGSGILSQQIKTKIIYPVLSYICESTIPKTTELVKKSIQTLRDIIQRKLENAGAPKAIAEFAANQIAPKNEKEPGASNQTLSFETALAATVTLGLSYLLNKKIASFSSYVMGNIFFTQKVNFKISAGAHMRKASVF